VVAVSLKKKEPWLEKGRIELTGPIPYSKVPGVLRSGTLALVPLLPTLNYVKAIPVKLIEYMAAGLPVIGSKFGHIERIVAETACGELVEAGNAQSLADAICRFIEDKEKSCQCAKRGWRAFREQYSWESEEPKLVRFFEKLTGI
jgi:glycosyltransferase involved in cell wall biosynthesis